MPTLIYSAKERKVWSVSGMGWSPHAFTIDWCRENGIDLIPGDGYLPACVPSVVDSWALAVARFGTLSFSQVLQPAIELAENGFPVYEGLHDGLQAGQRKYTDLYPTTGEVYLPGGRAPEAGEVLRNPDWANVLKTMCAAEAAAKGKGRVAGIEAARDAFYQGEIAHRMVDFMAHHPVMDASGKAHTGLLSYADIAEWRATLDEPVRYNYRGLDVYKCSSWTQGPVFLQQLALLEGYDLAGHGPQLGRVPAHPDRVRQAGLRRPRGLLRRPPGRRRAVRRAAVQGIRGRSGARSIGREASREMRPGDVGGGVPEYAATFDVAADNRRAMALLDAGEGGGKPRPYRTKHTHMGDTTHLDAVDREGNMVASTPSGGWIGSSPVVKGLGFPMGTRGQMFYLNPDRPNALAPRKRPRATLTPSLVLRDGQPHMVVRHARRRQPGPMDAAVLPQRGRLRHGPAGGARRADGALAALPIVVLPARRLPCPHGGREPHRSRSDRRAGTARA